MDAFSDFRAAVRAVAAALFDPPVRPGGWSANNAMLLYTLVTWGLVRAETTVGYAVDGTDEEVLGIWKRTEALLAKQRSGGATSALDPVDLAFYNRFRSRTGKKINVARTIGDNFKYYVALGGKRTAFPSRSTSPAPPGAQTSFASSCVAPR